jgi:hypothetical protein
LPKSSEMRIVPWKSGASAPRNMCSLAGLQPPWSHFCQACRKALLCERLQALDSEIGPSRYGT